MVQKVILSFFFLFIFAFTLVSAAELPTHQLDTDLEIYQECYNCTYCNFSVFKDPSGTNILTNIQASQSGSHWSYIVGAGNITEKGVYTYCYDCGNTAEGAIGCIDVNVTYTGNELSLPETILYLGVLVFLVGLFGYILYLYPKLPRDAKNDDGYVINMSSFAYLRPIAIGFLWILLLSITFIIANISIAYVSAGFLGNFIWGIYTILMYSNLVIIPLYFLYLIINSFKRAKLKEFLERGGMDFA